MGLDEILVILLAAGLVIFTIVHNIRKRKKSSCGGCSGCGDSSTKCDVYDDLRSNYDNKPTS